MAKWGEGDPRWIVEERPDATNVNNWHWTEKNASAWSTDMLKELLCSVSVEDAAGAGEVTEVSSISGEASANNRKGKIIFFYEWEIKLKWKSVPADSEHSVKGTVEIPNLSEENDIMNDVDVIVSVDSDGMPGAYEMKQMWIRVGTPLIKKQLQLYLKKLADEFAQGMVLPTVTTTNCIRSSSSAQSTAGPSPSTSTGGQVDCSTAGSSVSSGLRIPTRKLTGEEEFQCSSEDLYLALTEKERVEAFTQSVAQVDAIQGGQFVLFGGNITGAFVELVPNKRIVQRWRMKGWPDKHYSVVEMELKQEKTCTKLLFTQTEIPETEYDRTAQGWTQYYWRSIQSTFGFGAHLV